MFRTRGRKVIRDVLSRKSRTAMAALSIFVGVLGVVILVSVGDLLVSQLKEDLKEDELTMQLIFTMAPSGVALDNEAYLEKLRALPGVTHVEGRATFPILWKHPGDEKFDDGYVLAASEPFQEIAIEPMRLVQGDYPVAGRGQVAVEKRMADKHGLELGDELVLRIWGGDEGVEQEKVWSIVGIVFQPYASFVSGGWTPNECSVFAAYEDARSIAGFAGFSSLLVRYTDYPTAEAQAPVLVATLAQETPYVPVHNRLENPAENEFIAITEEIAEVLVLLALVALVVAGFLVTNIINTIVLEQTRQIGVLKSLGATRWDNFVMYACIALVYGVIGTVPGVLLGVPLSYKIAAAIAELPNALIDEFVISSRGILVGSVMGLVVPLLAAAVPVFLGTRVSILQAMTDLGISVKYGDGLLARLISALPLSMNMRQALSNVTRKKGRLVLTWLTLALAAASFMGIFGVFFSLNKEIADQFDTFGYEIQISPNEAQNFEALQALILENVEGVRAVYPGSNMDVQLEGYFHQMHNSDQLHATGFDPRTDTFALDYEAGRGWQDDSQREGIVLTSGVAEQLGKRVGEKALVSLNGQSTQFEIIGIVSFSSDALLIDWRRLAQMAGFTSSGEPIPNGLFVQTENANPTADQVDDVMDEIANVLLANGITARYENQVKSAEQDAREALTFGMIFSITAAVMAAVGALGLLAVLSMSVFERQKEIGVMRSIGANSRTVAGLFLAEGILVGIAAWLVGIPLSYLLSQNLTELLPLEVNDIPYPSISLAVGLVGIILISTVASLWPSISAARKTVSEIIRYQ